MITQRLILDGPWYSDSQWCCPGCPAKLTNGVLAHEDTCTEVGQPEPQAPPVARLHAYMRETGWQEGFQGRAGSMWRREGGHETLVPYEDDHFAVRSAITRIGWAEGRHAAEVAKSILAMEEATDGN